MARIAFACWAPYLLVGRLAENADLLIAFIRARFIFVFCHWPGVPASPIVNKPSTVIPGAGLPVGAPPVGTPMPTSLAWIDFCTAEMPLNRINPIRAMLTNDDEKT